LGPIRVRTKKKTYVLAVYLPPYLTGITFLFLLSSLGNSTWADAHTWPLWGGKTLKGADKELYSGIAIYRVFVFATALLVFLNNLVLYMTDIWRAAEEANPAFSGGRSARRSGFVIGIITTILVLFWLIDTVLSFMKATGLKHEAFAFIVFLLFASIDLLLARNAKARLAEPLSRSDQDRLEAERQYYGGQALFTDLPVVVGMTILFLIGAILKSLPAYTPPFSYGFLAGAVGMHLAYSQFVFLGLTLRYRQRLRQINLDKDAAATPDSLEIPIPKHTHPTRHPRRP
jgi:hypothetical protein